MTQRIADYLFEEGAQRFRELHADSHRQMFVAHPHLRNGFYVCPLCLRAFGRQSLEHGHLSIEHVPPSNRGGPFAESAAVQVLQTAPPVMNSTPIWQIETVLNRSGARVLILNRSERKLMATS